VVKIPKPTTLIMRPRYPHKKQVKTDYEAQFSIGLVLNNEIEKKSIKNKTKNNRSLLGLTV